MGLVISSLTEINPELSRRSWLYLLDYGLKSDVADAIRANFVQFAERSSETESVFVLGTSRHVQSEILSWHSVFDLPGEKHLPALLVSTINPRLLMSDHVSARELAQEGHKAILIPLSGKETTTDEALMKIDQVFDSLRTHDLEAIFRKSQPIAEVSQRPILMLQPNVSGIGIDFNEVWRRFRERH